MRRYVVTGSHAAPNDFEEYVYDQLKKREPLRLTATEDQDDLARKRSPATPQEFTFRIRELHKHDDFYLNVTDAEGHWIRIESAETVSFVIFDF